MDTIFINSENSKKIDPHRLLLNLLNKINLTRSNKYVFLSNLCIHYTFKNIKRPCKNNRFKRIASAWNKKLELFDGSDSMSDIQDYFEYIIKKYQIVTNIKFKIKTGYYLIF